MTILELKKMVDQAASDNPYLNVDIYNANNQRSMHIIDVGEHEYPDAAPVFSLFIAELNSIYKYYPNNPWFDHKL